MGTSTKDRVLIAGSGGQLGRALAARLGGSSALARVWAPPEDLLDITSPDRVREAVAAHRPDWVVNCAAYTAVDAAEKDRERAWLVNDTAVGILADAALEGGARLVHVSTDYVFDGSKEGSYVEEDIPSPINAYGASKLAGEIRALAHPVGALVLRTAWLYSEGGRNFVTWALENGRKAAAAGEELPIVTDGVGSPTDAHTLAAQIEAGLEAGLEGLHHAAALGEASWWDFAGEIFRLAEVPVRLRPILGADLKRPARRPGRVVLDDRKLRESGRLRMRPWKDGLRDVIARMRGGTMGG